MDRDLETAVPEGRGSVTVGGSARSLRRERTLILALLLILAAASFDKMNKINSHYTHASLLHRLLTQQKISLKGRLDDRSP